MTTRKGLGHLEARYFETRGRSAIERSRRLQEDQRHRHTVIGSSSLRDSPATGSAFGRQGAFRDRLRHSRHDGQIIKKKTPKTYKKAAFIACLHSVTNIGIKVYSEIARLYYC